MAQRPRVLAPRSLCAALRWRHFQIEPPSNWPPLGWAKLVPRTLLGATRAAVIVVVATDAAALVQLATSNLSKLGPELGTNQSINHERRAPSPMAAAAAAA